MISTDIDLAAEFLRLGEVIAIPTETVYGLAGNIYDCNAIEKIFTIKQRPKNDPLIVHIHNIAQLEEITISISHAMRLLMKKFWPGALTFLLPKSKKISDDITAGNKFVAVRMPDHLIALQLLEKVDFPLAAPSANLFQRTSPTTPQHVEDQLGDSIPIILDGGPCGIGIESTIIGFDENENVNVFRLGGVPVEEIKQTIGGNIFIKSSSQNLPGNFKLHYSTNKPLIIGDIEQLLQQYHDKRLGILSFKKKYDFCKYQFLLSESGNLVEAAKNLYKGMRILDEMPIEVIIAEYVPNEGLGKAINDRLLRASLK